MAGLSAENKLRDVFNPKTVSAFAGAIKNAWPKFDREGFLGFILPKLDALGFGERSLLITDSIAEFLPKDFPAAISILLKALPQELKEHEIAAWESFVVMPQCAFVSKHGKDYFDISMKALYEMTKRFSAEGDLRTFIEIDYGRAMKILHEWREDPNPHVRRLVSEGTRPRLQLAGRIRRFQKDPRPVIALLDGLKDDPSEYVRRSVANNINDIAKDNPDIAIDTLKRWNGESKPEVKWVVRHAARGLIKQGHPEAIAVLGCSPAPRVKVSEIAISPKKQKQGGVVEFSFSIRSLTAAAQKLIVDYAVHYQKSNGKLLPKVFKLRNLTLSGGKTTEIKKTFTLKNTSGRTIYPGLHEIEIQVNGRMFARNSFIVEEENFSLWNDASQ